MFNFDPKGVKKGIPRDPGPEDPLPMSDRVKLKRTCYILMSFLWDLFDCDNTILVSISRYFCLNQNLITLHLQRGMEYE